ncbi:MAG: ABC transporter ATP-binding protein [Candidatus Lokiarchaeota archaeon]|nr:ABC transporter ATP-binding protein [Candidatus Lokiarchaeota archaeon]MCK4280513.1 ABC transporter ATP-binding protein [Candidatus Lokiarchaeota archaeon]
MEKKLENLQILVNHLTYHYPDGTIALKGINLNIYSGEIVGIMGKNGAGKSTLIKTFNGLLKPTTGTVYIENDEVNNVLMSKLTRKVGIVFQNPDLQLFANTVEDEIKFSLKNLNFSKTELENQIYLTLEKFKLKKFQNRTPFTLSGGEKKRLAIASIMCRNPEIIVFDEPTIGQDAEGVEFIKNLIKEKHAEGKTIIIVTHDIEFAIDNIPRTILMADGLIVADGPTNKILSQDQILNIGSLISPQLIKLSKFLIDLKLKVPEDVYIKENMVQFLGSYFKDKMGITEGGKP